MCSHRKYGEQLTHSLKLRLTSDNRNVWDGNHFRHIHQTELTWCWCSHLNDATIKIIFYPRSSHIQFVYSFSLSLLFLPHKITSLLSFIPIIVMRDSLGTFWIIPFSSISFHFFNKNPWNCYSNIYSFNRIRQNASTKCSICLRLQFECEKINIIIVLDETLCQPNFVRFSSTIDSFSSFHTSDVFIFPISSSLIHH